MTPSPLYWKTYRTWRGNSHIIVVRASQFVSKKGGGSQIIRHTEVEWATEAYDVLQAGIKIEQRWRLGMTVLPKD